jgi:phosphonate transport system substrate-binding protein
VHLATGDKESDVQLRLLWLLSALVTAAIFAACRVSPQQDDADARRGLAFGVIATESTRHVSDQWEPFFQDLSAVVGMPVKGLYASDYAGVIEAMRFGKVDIAWLGNKAAIEAVDRAGAEVFAHLLDKTGYPGYHSVLIVNQDSDLYSLADVLSRPGQLRFGNGDPNSTSGFLVPSYFAFAKHGIDPARHFRRVTNSNHEFNALAVGSGQLDVATCNTIVIGDPDRDPRAGTLWDTQPVQAARLRVIWKSPLISSDPLVNRKLLSAALKQKIRDAIYAYGQTADQRRIMDNLSGGLKAFQPSTDEHLIPSRIVELSRDRLLATEDGARSRIDAEILRLEQMVPSNTGAQR